MEEIKRMLTQLMEGQEEINIQIKKMDFKLEELDKKVDLSLEGHKSNTEQLGRIESEVTRHEEFIIRRVK